MNYISVIHIPPVKLYGQLVFYEMVDVIRIIDCADLADLTAKSKSFFAKRKNKLLVIFQHFFFKYFLPDFLCQWIILYIPEIIAEVKQIDSACSSVFPIIFLYMTYDSFQCKIRSFSFKACSIIIYHASSQNRHQTIIAQRPLYHSF